MHNMHTCSFAYDLSISDIAYVEKGLTSNEPTVP